MKRIKEQIAAWYPWLAISQLILNIVLIVVISNGFDDTKSAAWRAGNQARTSVTNASKNLQAQNNKHTQELLKINATITSLKGNLELALGQLKRRCSK